MDALPCPTSSPFRMPALMCAVMFATSSTCRSHMWIVPLSRGSGVALQFFWQWMGFSGGVRGSAVFGLSFHSSKGNFPIPSKSTFLESHQEPGGNGDRFLKERWLKRVGNGYGSKFFTGGAHRRLWSTFPLTNPFCNSGLFKPKPINPSRVPRPSFLSRGTSSPPRLGGGPPGRSLRERVGTEENGMQRISEGNAQRILQARCLVFCFFRGLRVFVYVFVIRGFGSPPKVVCVSQKARNTASSQTPKNPGQK